MVDVIARTEPRGVERPQAVGYREIVLGVAIAEKDQIFLGGVEINAEIEIIEVADLLTVGDVVVQDSPGHVWLREGLQIFQAHGIGIGDEVSGKRRAGDRIVNRSNARATPGAGGHGSEGGAEEFRKVRSPGLAGECSAHPVVGNGVMLDAIGIDLAPSLVVGKTEELVLPNCSAHRAAELRLPENDGSGLPIGLGGTETAAAEQKRGTMQGVASRLDAGLQNRAAALAELCGRNAGVDLEFLDRLCRREEDNAVDESVVVVDAVEDEIVGLRTQAVCRQGRAAGLRVAEGLGVRA